MIKEGEDGRSRWKEVNHHLDTRNQAIFKINDPKKDVTCMKFMDPCNFQVPWGLF
jgi:hypothetical protein